MEPCTEPVNAVAPMLPIPRGIDSALEVTGKRLEAQDLSEAVREAKGDSQVLLDQRLAQQSLAWSIPLNDSQNALHKSSKGDFEDSLFIEDTNDLSVRSGTKFPQCQITIPFAQHPQDTDLLKAGREQEPEIIQEEQQGALAQTLLHDAERLANPQNVVNQVVYDSFESPLMSEEIPVVKDCADKIPSIQFESRFESGNLRRAIRVYDTEYDLILRPDVNTHGHTQWFYFAVQNIKDKVKYKFNIINLVKHESLFQKGMQPLIWSTIDAKRSGLHWRRWGTNICYYQNTLKRRNGKRYFSLSMTIEFPRSDDRVFIAYCYPYTYTDLQRYLSSLMKSPERSQIMQRRLLCQSLAGNGCDLLTITSPESPHNRLADRKGVILSARVHPGESNASYIMIGALDFLTGPSPLAKEIRDKFICYVVPMLNPDGVINGNYRCSLAAVDLNRVWDQPSRNLHPTIYHMKELFRSVLSEREVVLFCDIHGHSRKTGSFIYGCDNGNLKDCPLLPGACGSLPHLLTADGQQSVRLKERIFPMLFNRRAPDLFNYAECNFKVQRSKESTARVVVWRAMGICNSFTLESSFAGPIQGSLQGSHYQTAHYYSLGSHLIQTLLDMFQPDMSLATTVYRELEILHGSIASPSGADTVETPGTHVESLEEAIEPIRVTDSDSDAEDNDISYE